MSKQNLVMLAVGAVLVGSFWLFGKSPQNQETSTLSQVIKDGAQLVDVRTADEYNSGYIDGSVNIPLDQLTSRLDDLVSKDSEIIVFCYSGGRAGKAKSILEGLGYQKVYNGGGWEALNQVVEGSK